ncbi:MAG: 4Fe-4S binding protein [Ignavibacteriae bacterium]|nr:4Fe-4S binding protein [Ignavibacteriota bacterium]
MIKKEKPAVKIKFEFDLLNIKPLRKLILWKWFPYIFQFFILIIFIVLIILGWNIFTPTGIPDKLFAKSNLVTLIIWGIWWPLMIITAVFFGRLWCMVCPLELVSNLSERISKKIGVKQKSLPGWIQSGAIIVILYSLIQILVPGIHLHRNPAFTSFFLAGLLSISVFIGVIYRDRAFCRGFCPIGILLNAYGRGSILAVRAKSKNICSDCNPKECIVSCKRYELDRRSCPSLLNPPKLNSNKDCLICGQCIKTCESENMQLLIREPFSKSDYREKKTNWSLTIFIILASGFVTSELTTEWKYINEIFLLIPNYINDFIKIKNFIGFIDGLWILFLFPLLLWTILGLVAITLKISKSVFDFWRSFALTAVIIISAGHIIKAVAKLNSWIGFLPQSLNDPNGINLAVGINNKSILSPGLLVGNYIVSFFGIIILSVFLFYSISADFSNAENQGFKSHIPKYILYILFLLITAGIGFQ